jgi:hypothetical protein
MLENREARSFPLFLDDKCTRRNITKGAREQWRSDMGQAIEVAFFANKINIRPRTRASSMGGMGGKRGLSRRSPIVFCITRMTYSTITLIDCRT